ncbi:hypothetical protein LP420_20495 [Massilia sp. B-10]|nr:hypothetical protein LP420_20495 [Massilia sp. B-10]
MLKEEKFGPLRSLASLNRLQPQVGIADIKADAGGSTVSVTVEVESVRAAAGAEGGGQRRAGSEAVPQRPAGGQHARRRRCAQARRQRPRA